MRSRRLAFEALEDRSLLAADGVSSGELLATLPAETMKLLDDQSPTAVLTAPASVEVGTDFVLDGSSSFAAGPGQIVEYIWTSLDVTGGGLIANLPMRTMEDTLTVEGAADPLPVGQHRFQLEVVDDAGTTSLPSVVSVMVAQSQLPTAVLTAPASVEVGTDFVLDGSSSFAAGPGQIVEYIWTSLDVTGGGLIANLPMRTMEDTLTVEGAADPLPVGQHRFQLEVVDDAGTTSLPSVVSVMVAQSQLPTAVLTAPASVEVGTDFVLDGSSSFAAGPGQIVEYIWTSLDVTGGGLIANLPMRTMEDTLTVEGAADPLPVGQHRFQLEVVDDAGTTSLPSVVSVMVAQSQLPTAVLTAPASVEVGTDFVLDGSSSFAAGPGQIVEYIWTSLDVTGGGLIANLPMRTMEDTLTVEGAADPLPVGQHRFQLEVVDDAGTTSLPSVVSVDVVMTSGGAITLANLANVVAALIDQGQTQAVVNDVRPVNVRACLEVIASLPPTDLSFDVVLRLAAGNFGRGRPVDVPIGYRLIIEGNRRAVVVEGSSRAVTDRSGGTVMLGGDMSGGPAVLVEGRRLTLRGVTVS